MAASFSDNRKKYIGVLGAFGLSVGTSIGWGSFVVTSSDYLSQAGLVGSIIGILIGVVLLGVIAYCYHFMMNKVPDSGGIYSFVKHTFNGDHAFLAAWFMIIVYGAILWANVTSISLFARYLFPGVFSFGKLYTLAGYDVYIGEILLCTAVLALVGGFTFLNKKLTSYVTFGLVSIFIAIILFVSIFSIIKSNGINIQEVAFVPGDGDYMKQIVSVVAMTPWAYIGFECISHATGSFTFKTSKAFKILVASLIASTVVYVLLCQISVMAHPAEFASWHAYVSNGISNNITSIPPFFVAEFYLGQTAGRVLFGIALACILATSIIGNLFALSNLVQRMAEDRVFPAKFAYVNKRDIPVFVRAFVLGITFFALLLGKSAISFIIDVNNICGVIVYAYISAAVMRLGIDKHHRTPIVLGVIGIIIALTFGAFHLAPIFSDTQSIAQETFITFVVCMFIGFIFFAFTLRRDQKGNFGNSSVVWVALTIVILFFSGVWVAERSKKLYAELATDISNLYAQAGGGEVDASKINALKDQSTGNLIAGLVTLFIILSLTMIVLFAVLEMIRRKSNKQKQEIVMMNEAINTDPLTGVKNNHAFIENERRLAQLIASGEARFAVAILDINDLKYVNDRFGHDAGDEYIRNACEMICQAFNRDEIYRIGGDEFIALIENEDYDKKEEQFKKIVALSEQNVATEDGIVIAAGLGDYKPGMTFGDVFHRADTRMYAHKKALKKQRPTHNLR